MCGARRVEVIFANFFGEKTQKFVDAIRHKNCYVRIAGGVVSAGETRRDYPQKMFLTCIKGEELPGATNRILVFVDAADIDWDVVSGAISAGVKGIIFVGNGMNNIQMDIIRRAAAEIPCVEVRDAPMYVSQAAFHIANDRPGPGICLYRS